MQNFYKLIKEVLDTILEFIYPENISCILCDRPIQKNNTYSMCKECFTNIHFILDGCVKCGKPIVNYSLEQQSIDGCGYCQNKTFYFDKAVSCLEYDNLSKEIIFKFKYSNQTYMSKYIALIMKEKLELENLKFDYILYVPLHKRRQNKRGFNQSQKIAKNLGKLIEVPVIDVLVRKEYTKRLFKLKKSERQKELKNAFILKHNIYELKNKNILLVDDIFTTGTTVNEISKMLKLDGINKVFVLSMLTGSN
ncbi:MAG: ComF family protein [Peptostreptococcaceae bacterium]